MKQSQIMIANGDQNLCQGLKKHLASGWFDVIGAPPKTNNLLNFFRQRKPNLVIIGPSVPHPEEGLKLANQIRQEDRKTPIILITKSRSESLVVSALRTGVSDYFKAPFSFDDLANSIRRNLGDHSHLSQGKPTATSPTHQRDLIGDSASMQEIKYYLNKVAATDSTVLITGETGTGKELAAELIHGESLRNRNPFVCVNCAALPESLIESEMFGYERGAFTGAVAQNRGKFELAQGGTLFLDEIADMSPYAQAKILRTIELKEIQRLGGRKAIPLDVRVIAATNQDPEQVVMEGKFREDLFYRLNVARVHLPPLRDRKEDIPRLIAHYIRNLNHRFGRDVEGLTGDAMASLLRYDWPGNIRELINLLEAAFVNLPSRKIAFMDLPKTFQMRFKETEHLPEKERDQVLAALFATKWNKSKAAKKLCWSRMTLYRKMVKYHIA